MSVVVNQKGSADAVGTGTSFNMAITATTGGNALLVVAYALGTLARVFSSNGTGTWTTIYDDGVALAVGRCLDPSAGTTQVTCSTTGAGFFTLDYMEVSGLKAAGLSTVASAATGAAVAAWATNAINPAYPTFMLAACRQGSSGSGTSSVGGTGFTGIAGTGIATNTVVNGSEGHSITVQYGDFAATPNKAAQGTWSGAFTWSGVVIGFETPAGGGGGTTSTNAKLGMKLSMGF